MTLLKQQLETEHLRATESQVLATETRLREQSSAMRLELEQKCSEDIRRNKEKLLQEQQQVVEDIKQTHQEEINRLKEKFERNLKESDEELLSKDKIVTKLKDRLMQLEELIIVLRANIKQKEQTIEQISLKKKELEEERSNMRGVIALEFQSEMENLQENRIKTAQELQKVKGDLTNNLLKHEKELEMLKQQYEQEAKQIHLRVKSALGKRDETEALLRADLAAAERRIAGLEEALTQQTAQNVLNNGTNNKSALNKAKSDFFKTSNKNA